ncbi:phosphoglycolate phosphatase [Fictibacillus phosphorivorans]|uniref:Phosphoglycolate phosphatase n=1 Tax=Fictibacillus phosphorivorans TaxID=1221500 RepID=A0A161IPP4_9BACL|nr:HAD family hydrolase [Fictibacillus phosphorivorans]ANC79475.1 phosphoglycolate phosphatase [Fictibacillus phosphorivorans]
MKNYEYILFDLDGTLSDPKIGITKSVQYALNRMGISEENLDDLESFIGPPLQQSFYECYSFDETQVGTAITYYRESFKDVGMFENTLYKHIPTLLQELKDNGHTLVVATSKPTVFAEEILKYFNVHHHFDLIVGSNLDGTRTSKTEIIQHILYHYNDQPKESFIMIGDRKHDIIGAHNTGIDSIGVTYGYGSMEELTAIKPTKIINSVSEIREFLLKDITIQNQS